jgi:general secretion pathway protein G
VASPTATGSGFTLIELLIVMSVLAILLTLVIPRYYTSIDKTKEAVLHENLLLMRESLDKYYGDNGKYPESLEDLVKKKYLRSVPVDPITDSVDTWVIVAPEEQDKGAVYDVKSGAPGMGINGSAYKDW